MMRAGFVIDYQNMHLVGNTLFAQPKKSSATFISPLRLAEALVRNQDTSISEVRVFRGLPSNQKEPRKYALNLRQKSLWEKSRSVSIHHVPLKYRANNLPPQEKGVDVLAAVNLFEMSDGGNFDLLYLLSHDTDFVPVIKLILELGRTQIISVGWQGRQPIRIDHESFKYAYLTRDDYWNSVMR